ncbi:MAG: sigma-54-dependent Fis family transcriptional regulator [candidate division Zixibacteria bacterium]|nr:sigma-54-dependent Fis family transcriptional regulator [Candidatus Tariuqbacter arcticus]
MSSSEHREQILVVDDAPDTLEVLQRNLTAEGYRVFTAPAVVEAIKILESTPVDLVITDLKMPGISGLDLVRHIRENYKDTEVMMITGYATINGAVNAVKTGAEEYLAKPFTDKELFSAVRRALDKLNLRKAGEVKAEALPGNKFGMIGESAPICKVFGAIVKAASTIATVLITGESGTGKELVARAIHYSSPRSSAPFVPVNCGGIPETLLESELFGHVKGAFTGASESRAGFFQTADGGTIFLDEISETSMAMQVKLLRVLQNKEICMVGSSRIQKVNVRIIAASNKDILSLIRKGIFREDLFFRLNIITINIPPLREREGDIPLLIRHFTANYAGEFGKPAPRFSERALQVLKNYYWPGNVRELENVIQRLVVMSEGEFIDVPDLPSLMRYSALHGNRLNRTLVEVEAEHIRNVLNSVDGHKSKAAEILGIDRKTLRNKLATMKPPDS